MVICYHSEFASVAAYALRYSNRNPEKVYLNEKKSIVQVGYDEPVEVGGGSSAF
jgi:hypothetical protein